MFKISSALCVDFFRAHIASGSSVPTAKEILDQSMGSMAALQTNVGQFEVQCVQLKGKGGEGGMGGDKGGDKGMLTPPPHSPPSSS